MTEYGSSLDGGHDGAFVESAGVDGGNTGAFVERAGVDGGNTGAFVERAGVDGGNTGAFVESAGVDGGNTGAFVERAGVDGGNTGAFVERAGVDGGNTGAFVERAGVDGGNTGAFVESAGVDGGNTGAFVESAGVDGGNTGAFVESAGVDGGNTGAFVERAGVDGGNTGAFVESAGVDGGNTGAFVESAGVDGGNTGAFVDGVVDTYERIAAVHGGRARSKHGNTVELTRFDDIVAVTKRRDVHSIDPDAMAIVSMALGAGRPLIPLMLDGEQHTKYRKLLDPLFAPKQVARLEPVIRNLSETLIDAFAADGAVDFFAAFCEPLPSQIFLSQLGLPLDDVPFLLWVKNGIIRPTDVEHQQAAGPKLIEYLYAELDRRAAESEPRDDLIGGFLTAEVDGHRLTREDVIDITFLLVLAGLDTVTASLSCMVDWLARHPAQRDRLVADPALLPQAIEELMRVMTPVVAGSRHATADFELDGVEVEVGDELRVVWAVANMDPDVFPEPTTVDFERANNRHIAFASGFHRCLGSHLARLELRVALETLHRRIPDYLPDPNRAPGYLNTAVVRCVDPLPLVFTPA